jgi:hypothetical protein
MAPPLKKRGPVPALVVMRRAVSYLDGYKGAQAVKVARIVKEMRRLITELASVKEPVKRAVKPVKTDE